MRRHPLRARALLLAALVLAPAAAAQPSPSSAPARAEAAAPDARVDAAQARVDALRAEADALSADLARVRGGMGMDGPDAEAALAAEERDLQARKRVLVGRLAQEERRLAAVTAAAAAEREREAVRGDAPGHAGADSPSGVVLAPSAFAAVGTDPAPAGTAPAAGVAAPPPAVALPPGAGTDAARIDGYLASKQSPLTGSGAVFVAEAAAVGLDPRMLVAIAGAETAFGTYGPSQAIHNPFGLGPGMRFASWADAIRFAARTLGGHLYRGDGRVTIPAINARWAPLGASNDPTNLNSNWTRNVGVYYAEQGGDPAGPVFTGVAASASVPETAAAPPAVAATPPGASPRAAAEALALLGTPHPREAGTGGLDAVGLVRLAYARQDVALPEGLAGLAGAGTPVPPLRMRAGDLVLFADAAGAPVHVALYVGAGQIVHAPGPGASVALASLYEAPWADAYAGARRP